MYTGYGQFFGQESNQCDGVTWVSHSRNKKTFPKLTTDFSGVLVRIWQA